MEKVARQVEAVVRAVPGTSSAYAERVIGGYYLDIVPDREALGRYGLMVGDVQDVIAMALGGESVTHTVEGRERYTINMRYPRGSARPAGDRQRGAGAAPSRRNRAAGRRRRGEAYAGRLPPSAPRTASSPSTSSLISETAISAATSRRRAKRSPTR